MAFESQVTLFTVLSSIFIPFSESGCSEGPYFDKLPLTKFESGNVTKTIYVEDETQCILNCLSLPECLSMNVADQAKQDGLFECILLKELTISTTGLLMQSEKYHYYFRRFAEGMCSLPRCKYGGTCITLVSDYRCLCQQRLTGKQCENLNCNTSSALGMEDRRITDQQLTAPNYYSHVYLPAYGRLRFGGAWVAKLKDVNQWFQIHLGSVTKVTGIATQGSPFHSEWVTSYSLQYSADSITYVDYEGGKSFSGNSDRNTVVKNDVNPAITARYIRVRPKAWYVYIALRVELYGCK